MVLSLTRPDLIQEYAQIIHRWNLKQIQVYLEETEAELIVRRGWYETTEFWTPTVWRAVIAPTLKREAELVHQAGRRFTRRGSGMHKPIKYAEKGLTYAARGAWAVFDRLNQVRRNESFTPT